MNYVGEQIKMERIAKKSYKSALNELKKSENVLKSMSRARKKLTKRKEAKIKKSYKYYTDEATRYYREGRCLQDASFSLAKIPVEPNYNSHGIIAESANEARTLFEKHINEHNNIVRGIVYNYSNTYALSGQKYIAPDMKKIEKSLYDIQVSNGKKFGEIENPPESRMAESYRMDAEDADDKGHSFTASSYRDNAAYWDRKTPQYSQKEIQKYREEAIAIAIKNWHEKYNKAIDFSDYDKELYEELKYSVDYYY